jgi:8-oxo-dGTP pyrophosphatase MutT (NUDIX family)
MPATPVPAATVILLRDGPVSPEVLLIERHSKSDFLPDLYVFPGGRVDDADRELADHVVGLSEAAARKALPNADPALALAFFVAAIRETYEEAGILLARRRGDGELVDPALAEQLRGHRLDIQAGETPFRELVERFDLELAADLMAVHAHWITPELVPKRFDTFFFSAKTPPGQLALHDGVESTDHVWIRPEDALEQWQKRERQMIFPTTANLETVAGFATVDDVLEASRARPVVPVLPVVEEHDGQRRVVIPENAGYQRTYELAGKAP